MLTSRVFHIIRCFLLAGTVGMFASTMIAAGSPERPEEGGKSAASDQEKAKKAEPATRQKPAEKHTVDSPILRAAKHTAAAEDDPLSFDNEDLERMIANLPPERRSSGVYQAPPPADGESESAAPDAPVVDGEPQSASEWLEQRQQDQTDRAVARSAAEQKIGELEAQIARLEQRALAIKNPFLKRPDTPERKEGQPAWDDMDVAERVKQTEEELADLRRQLQDARQELARLQ